ncbi:MAG: FtsX-like permease family protein [Coriobacteriia bacterium]|nr:FtsX-like permease family protein [Coriobacteriia bacterium]
MYPRTFALLHKEIKQSLTAILAALILSLAAPAAFIAMSLSQDPDIYSEAFEVFSQICLVLPPVISCLWATALFSGIYEISARVLLVWERRFLTRAAARFLFMQVVTLVIGLVALYFSEVQNYSKAMDLLLLSGLTSFVFFLVIALCAKLFRTFFPGILITIFAMIIAYGDYLGWIQLPNWWILVHGERSFATQLLLVVFSFVGFYLLLFICEKPSAFLQSLQKVSALHVVTFQVGTVSMDFFNRIWASLTRNVGRNLLILFVLFALGIVVSGAISVHQATSVVRANLLQEFSPVVTVELDQEALEAELRQTGQWPEPSDISLEVLLEIANLPQVRNYDISIYSHLLSAELERYYSNEEVHQLQSLGRWQAFALRGIHGSKLVDIEEGIIEIVAGRSFSEDEAVALSYVALISEEVAKLNHLHIGSNFSMNDIIWDTRNSDPFVPFRFLEDDIYTQRSYDFEVIGIFRSVAQFHTGDSLIDDSLKHEHINQIYVPSAVAVAVHMYQMEYAAYLDLGEEWTLEDLGGTLSFQNVFVLTCPQDIESFREDVLVILPAYWTVSDLSCSMAGTAAVENIGDIAAVVLWLAAVASILILSLFITLLMRERRQEIGIYLALGEKKRKIVAQLTFEVLAIALIAAVLSLTTGNMLALKLSETIIRSEMTAAQRADSQAIAFTNLDMMGHGIGEVSSEEILAHYDTSLDVDSVVNFLAFGAAIIVVVTVTSTLYVVMRFAPREIVL